MTTTRVQVRTVTPAGAQAPLVSAWVYWKAGNLTFPLRTNATGVLHSLAANSDTEFAASYSTPFTANVGDNVEVHYSSGVRRTPDARLSENADAFVARTVAAPAAPPAPTPTPVAPNSLNTVVAAAISVLLVPLANVKVVFPEELSLWPLLWEPHSDTYLESNLAQGTALLPAPGYSTWSLAEAGAPPALLAADEIKERVLFVRGTIDARVTTAEVSVLAADGSAVPLLDAPPAPPAPGAAPPAAPASHPALPVTLEAPAGAVRGFSVAVRFEHSAAAFGPVQVMVRSTAGVTPRIVATYACYLTGVQIALSADVRTTTSPNSTARQPAPNASAEKIIFDFEASPQASKAALAAEARARRMVRYEIGIADRLLPGSTTVARTPEMPMWRAELDLVGLGAADLENWLLRLQQKNAGTAVPLELAASFEMQLGWDGPNAAAGGTRPYSYSFSLPAATSTLTLQLDPKNNQLAGKTSDQKLTGAVRPATAAPAFPLANRLPAEVLLDQARPWGRSAGATTRPSLVLEWQPVVTDAGLEIIRGGDGSLNLATLTVGGRRITTDSAAAPAGPDATLPTFRVVGTNPTQADMTTIANALCDKLYAANPTVASIQALTLICWQHTVQALVLHESGYQFDHNATRISREYEHQFYGLEKDMPIFGPPAGYGYGQIDNPAVTDQQCWSFLDNLQASVDLVMRAKASGAWGSHHAHFSTPLVQRDRAVFRREIVRRFNGGQEFIWNGSAFVIQPTLRQWQDPTNHALGAYRNLNYPNHPLGTSIVYFVGTGATTTFPWPIAFTAANYGPDL